MKSSEEIFLEEFIQHVAFDGWSERSIDIATQEIGFSLEQIDHLFPKGINDVFMAYSRWLDKQMLVDFEADGTARKKSPVHQIIRQLVLCRLRHELKSKELVRQTVSFAAKPQNFKLANRALYFTVDQIWRSAGDRSTDFNFYTKRATLAAVYGSTLISALSDNSADMEKTEAFLDRRLRDVSYIPKVKQPLQNAIDFGAFILKRGLSTFVR